MDYVFDTTGRKRYQFPTHINDIVVDRAEASVSEVFVVIVEPGKATHLHKHDDTEQIFYVVEGEGILVIGAERKEIPVKPTQVIRIPPNTLHTIRTKDDRTLKYIAVDCFLANRASDEPTWDAHVHTICKEQGYDYERVVSSGYAKA